MLDGEVSHFAGMLLAQAPGLQAPAVAYGATAPILIVLGVRPVLVAAVRGRNRSPRAPPGCRPAARRLDPPPGGRPAPLAARLPTFRNVVFLAAKAPLSR